MERLLTVDDLRERYRVSRETIRRWGINRARTGFPAPMRVPGTRLVRWSPQAIEAWEKRAGRTPEAR